jgi:hypothetical protein
MYHWFWASTLHGVGPLPSHVVMISLMPSCICHVWLSKRMSSSITPRIDSVWKFLPQWVMSSSMLEFEKVLFHSEHPLELLDQEDQVRMYNTSRVMKHNPSLHGAMSFRHERKSGRDDWEVLLFSTVSIPDILLATQKNASFIILVPAPSKSPDKISFF